jgi:hypothetical protein
LTELFLTVPVFFLKPTVILFLFLTIVRSSQINTIPNITDLYLEQFGYLESNDSLLTETSESLIRVQESYNLPADGTLNQSTFAMINKPRCGVKDNPTLKWDFLLAKKKKMKELAQKAFDQCQSVSNLKFQYNSIKPDTYIFHFLMRCFSVIIIHGSNL